MKFGVHDADGGRTHILESLEAIAANGHANAVVFGFTRPHGTNKVGICHFAASRDLMGFDEDHRVIALDGGFRCAIFGESSCTATPFVGKRGSPNDDVWATERGVNGFSLTGIGIEHFTRNGGIMLDRLRQISTWYF